MPELTKSSVGSFCGTSGLEGTMVCPLERKYSRKLERISLDFTRRFYFTNAKSRGAADTPEPLSQENLGVDAPVLEQPRAHRAHRALVRRRELLQRAPSVERRQQLAILFLAPRLARLGGHLRPAPFEALDALQRARCLVQCPHYLRPLVGALRRKDFPALRIDAVRQRPHHLQCLCLVHSFTPSPRISRAV